METPRDVYDKRMLLITILPRGDVADDKKRMLVLYDKKRTRNIIILSRGMLKLEPAVNDKKRRLVVYDKKKMQIIIILSWGDVRMVKWSRIMRGDKEV